MPTHDEAVRIRVDDQHLAGTLVAPATTIPGVLFVHGWGGSQEQYLARAREVAALGCVSLTFDLRGHAQSDGQNEAVSREDNLRDVLAAYDVLAGRPDVDSAALAVVGSSYGGYLAALLTALRPVRWLGLRAPALYKDAGWTLPKRSLHKEELAAYRRRPVRPEENRALAACAAFEGDVLLVASEHDDVVPHPAVASFRAAFGRARSLTYRVIAGADHGLSAEAWQRAYTALVVGWVSEMVLGARASEGGGALSRREEKSPARGELAEEELERATRPVQA